MIQPNRRLKRIRMDITDNCNLRCSICTIHDQTPKGQCNYFPYDAFATAFRDSLAGIGNFQLGNIAEPLMHPEFDRFVDYLRSEFEGTILIQTNGLLLDRHLEALERNRCTVNVSLDSMNPTTYARIRKGSNLERVMGALDRIDAGACEVVITPVLMNSTVDEYPAFVEFARSHRFKLAGVPMVVRSTSGIVAMENIQECLWFNKSALTTLRDTFFGEHREPFVVAQCFSRPEELSAFSCNAHHEDAIILADGTCMLCFSHSLGSISQDRFDTLFYGGSATEFRHRIDTGDASVCESCNYRIQCLTPSVDHLRNHVDLELFNGLSGETRKLLSFDSPLSDAEQLNLFIDEISRTNHVCDFFERDGFIYACPVADTVVRKRRHELEAAILRTPHKPTHLAGETIYRGFRFVKAADRHYAIAIELSNVDLAKTGVAQYLQWQKKHLLFAAATSALLKREIDQWISSRNSERLTETSKSLV